MAWNGWRSYCPTARPATTWNCAGQRWPLCCVLAETALLSRPSTILWAGCGINAKARETESPNYVQVYFPDVPGIPDRFDQLKIIIEEILPCQLGIEYVFWYLNWMQLEDKFANWDAIERKKLEWEELQTYVE